MEVELVRTCGACPESSKINKRLLWGKGINDSDYNVTRSETMNGKRKVLWTCPFYTRWTSMLARCYSSKLHERSPSYVGCSVAEPWLYFSNFRKWMVDQDWEEKELDKDLLIRGNKVYSENTCVFISRKINLFISEVEQSRGEFPIGVTFHATRNKFRADCRCVVEERSKHLGFFDNSEEAHLAWLSFKLQQAYILAEEQNEPKVAAALINRYIDYRY